MTARRTEEESCALIDRIIGRCLRDGEFADRVLADPETTLAEYELDEDEMDDFRALKNRHFDEAKQGWAEVRSHLRDAIESDRIR